MYFSAGHLKYHITSYHILLEYIWSWRRMASLLRHAQDNYAWLPSKYNSVSWFRCILFPPAHKIKAQKARSKTSSSSGPRDKRPTLHEHLLAPASPRPPHIFHRRWYSGSPPASPAAPPPYPMKRLLRRVLCPQPGSIVAWTMRPPAMRRHRAPIPSVALLDAHPSAGLPRRLHDAAGTGSLRNQVLHALSTVCVVAPCSTYSLRPVSSVPYQVTFYCMHLDPF